VSGDERLDTYTPSFGFKAGTSFAAPNVAGFAALLYGLDEDAGPEAVREQIESTAQRLPVGRAGETTAPGASVNESFDGDFDGDQPSSPGSVNIGALQADDYRGEGHINILPAINTFGNGRGRN
jgi:subtilisin family serine protease